MTYRTYAIGDVHGRMDLLNLMMDQIHQDRALDSAPARAILLGDYIDRGPESRQVVEFLMGACKTTNDLEVIALKGNHEDLLVKGYRDPNCKEGETWFLNGGMQTLESYDLMWEDPFQTIPAAHIDFLESLPTIFVDELRIFVHAGLNPLFQLDEQPVKDLLWWRNQESLRLNQFGKLIVHGHEPHGGVPSIDGGHINLDTKAYRRGVLSCAVFDPGEYVPRILQVHAS
ncbi:metallophosphoesterase family protein [Microvirga tunisiensis]|nr:metallophosphoesterase family protein [Microvirga tunisiensis]